MAWGVHTHMRGSAAPTCSLAISANSMKKPSRARVLAFMAPASSSFCNDRMFSYVPPEISTKSTSSCPPSPSSPPLASIRITSTLSSRVIPPCWKSLLFSLTPTTNCGPTLARTARSTSSNSRRRFTGVPPHSSVRRLTLGDRNWLRRYPCAECTCTPEKPACLASSAVRANLWSGAAGPVR